MDNTINSQETWGGVWVVIAISSINIDLKFQGDTLLFYTVGERGAFETQSLPQKYCQSFCQKTKSIGKGNTFFT